MARTVLSNEDLIAIEKEYGTITDSALAKKWHIGVPRLKKEMQTFYNRQKVTASLKNKKKGTKLSEEEISDIIQMYTKENKPISHIAKEILRSATAVRNALVKNNIPLRTSIKKTSSRPKILGNTNGKIELGNRVFSHKYNAYAVVDKILSIGTYRVWVEDPNSENNGGFFAYRPRSDLALLSD